MFGGIFDFNRDGETDAFELAVGFNIAFGSEEESSEDDPYEDEEDDDYDFEGDMLGKKK